MKLLFEKSVQGRGCDIFPDNCGFEQIDLGTFKRKQAPHLPEISESELSRHYSELAKRTYGVNNGFYPLGSCTMKYNPKVNEAMANLETFTQIHPLQPIESIQGCLEILSKASKYLCEITGMDAMTFQPAAGAHGEFTGLLLIKAYHDSRNDHLRNKIIIPDAAHGTNPATANMLGYQVITIPSNQNGGVDIEKLKAAVGDDTAGLMLTNPNTIGLFDENILEITEIIHQVGGLNYYDGANLNAIMGIVKPGDMGFDIIHLNLHKTFSTPHGGGGAGSGPCGCKEFLTSFLPKPIVINNDEGFTLENPLQSVGKVKAFYGNFLVVVKALTYILTLGKEGVKEVSQNAVLNANYMMKQLADTYDIPYGNQTCMHEFVISLAKEKHDLGISAMDIAKSLLDHGIHPPTMYFPLIIHEALMIEPTETETKETLDEVIAIFKLVYQKIKSSPDELHASPILTPIRRVDEVKAARQLHLRYNDWNKS